jgi:sulfoxide reductase heme-binding subunit YedZ
MTALTLMLPLAATSTVAAIKKLGGRNWQRLHRLAYVIGVCGVLHYLWLAKKANPAPYYYAAGLAPLLLIRGWDWAHRRAVHTRTGATSTSGQSETFPASLRGEEKAGREA